MLLYKYLPSVYDVQSLLQGTDSLALEVIDGSLSLGEGWGEAYSCRLCIKFAGESLIVILHSHSVSALGVVGDVDVEAYDAAGVDSLLIDGFARLVSNAHQIGIVERVEVDAKLLFVVFTV